MAGLHHHAPTQKLLGLRWGQVVYIAYRQKVQREPSLLSRPALILPFFIYLMCDHICEYAHSNMCVEIRGQPPLSFLRNTVNHISRQGLSVTWNSPTRLNCLATKPQGPALSPLPHLWFYRHALARLAFPCGFWDQTPAPHACTSASLSEPSFQPPSVFS